jgi:hypothetical protein
MRFLIITIGSVLWACSIHAQSTVTYTVDEDFTTGTMLSGIGDVGDIYPLEDGGFFLGGTFNPMSGGDDNSPFTKGIAMITESGGLHQDWNGIGMQRALEIHDHQGGYLVPTSQGITKLEYTGENWYFTQGDYWGDYYLFGEFGSGWDNPYNVNWTWDIYIEEDESVLIGGAIATDTLQPAVFRHLMRLLADGSHDDTFPVIEAFPYDYFTYISRIDRASDGSWYVSGRFEGINGHYSPHIVHLTPEFEVDTDFVSPVVFQSIPGTAHVGIRLLDNQDRLWVSGRRILFQDAPTDTLSLIRLLPNGDLDPDFQPKRVKSDYPQSWTNIDPWIVTIKENLFQEGDYFVAGAFNSYDNTEANCITVVDDQGNIQDNYFQGDGPLFNQYHLDNPDLAFDPGIIAIEQQLDGSLILGGGFSEFMGVERYHLVKLNQGTVSTRDQDRLEGKIKVYPNPARDRVTIQLVTSAHFESAQWPGGSGRIESLRITDLSGRTVASFPRNGDNASYDVSHLAKGVYVVQIMDSDTVIGLEKLVVH